jgi:hypothetical protein
MISQARARSFAESAFPEAPERLAKDLGIDVRYSPLSGCDGWCLVKGKKAIIHVNNKLSAVRQRFTLAHELGHLILSVPTVVGETHEDMLRSDSDEERRVNDLASALLIPAKVARESLSEPPLITAALQKLAKKAKVSELAAAIRVCNLAQEIGLINVSVVLFDGEYVRWQWSRTLTMLDETAVRLLAEARNSAPTAYREVCDDNGDIVVASTIENPSFGSATLFVQRLPAAVGMKVSRDERRRILESELLADDPKLRQRLSGLMGAHKNRTANRTQAESETDFWKRNFQTLKDTPVVSKKGREYVRLRINEWFSTLVS